MQQLTAELIRDLLEPHEPPCVSIYQPTHRSVPGIYGDPVRYRNLVRRAETELKLRWGSREIASLMKNLESFSQDRGMWNAGLGNIAVFSSNQLFLPVRIPRDVPELVAVADNFHIRPLIRITQTAGRFQVLCLTRQEVRLLEGNRDNLDEVPLKGTPRTMAEAFGEQINAPHATSRQGAGMPDRLRGEHAATPETGVMDLERFFRMVDHGILLHHSRPTGLPMILCALEDTQDLFRKITGNNLLLDERITKDPQALDHRRLHAMAWQIIEPFYHDFTARTIDAFQAAKARRHGSTDLREVAEASTHGRVQTLLIDANKHIGGKIDARTGQVWFGAKIDPQLDDLLDDTAEQVLKMGGQVMVIPPDLMPTDTGVAAIYRF